ncbi:MAG: NADH-quinone oxidoreductase subunit NuoF [Bacteroidota bacterium]
MNNFKKLQEKAKDEWQALQNSAVPVIYVGMGSCGLASGAGEVWDNIHKTIAAKKIKAQVVKVGCIGPCYLEPIVDIQKPGRPRISFNNITSDKVNRLISEYVLGDKTQLDTLGHLGEQKEEFDGIKSFWDQPMLKDQKRIVLRNCGIVDPENINHYIARGGFNGLLKALDTGPESVIKEMEISGMRGRGGAGFPTFRKWQFCRGAKGSPKYLICNADEGDPGAFMNRSLIEGDPFALLEGMIIASFAIGANYGYIYIRAEYPLAIERLNIAINQMRKIKLIGKNILNSGFNFEIKVKEGAGAFVCGEETALIASIEGQRGMPRSRPPFPAVSGLFGKPTNINNVETLGTVPNIMREGGKWFAGFGTKTSKGTKTFALVGKVRRTGLIEVPLGTTLKKIIFDIGGGTEKSFKAVQTGGPSGGCLSESNLNLPVDYESLADAGSIMGSGGLIVMDEDNCMVDIARYFLSFTSNESCGKCTPCRIGTKRMVEILGKITERKGKLEDIKILESLSKTIMDGSLCGLGQTAANPVLTTLRYFRDEYEKHIINKKCDAFVCNKLVGAPCQTACPVDTEAWRYIAHIERGEYEDAYKTIREANPFPSVCARVCNHPCEEKCRAGTSGGENIAIRALKRFITDNTDPKIYKPKFSKTSKKLPKVAIIGAGPAGLSAAHYLSLQGYKATIFEANNKPGGMLLSGIPEFRLPHKIIEKEIKLLIDENITLKCNTELGRDVSIKSLFKDKFKAVFLSIGAHKSLRLEVKGEDTNGVYLSMPFLKAFNLKGKTLAKGKVGVIGGGNSAIDAARVAIRQKGVDEVTILYRRTRNEMPAFEEEIEGAIQEGIKLETLISPMKIHSDNDKLTGVECIKNELGDFDLSGRRRPVPISGSEYTIPLDTLIVAISEQPESDAISSMKIDVTKWGTVKVDTETLTTNIPGVFAGGDLVSGPNTVIEAIADGKKAARKIDCYLKGEDMNEISVPQLPEFYIEPPKPSDKELDQTIRIKTSSIPVKSRKHNFNEVELTFSDKKAIKEARRCLRCDLEFTKP